MPTDASQEGQTPGRKRRTPLTDGLAPETIGFRLDEEHRRLLAQRSKKAGAGPHDMARAYVMEALHDQEQIPAMREAIQTLHGEITQLRADLALAVEAILVTGNDLPEDEARAWVQKHLHRS